MARNGINESGEVCKTTRLSSVRWAIFYSVIISFVICLVLAFFGANYAYTKMKTELNSRENVHRIVSQYEILDSKFGHKVLNNKIIRVENSLVEMLGRVGVKRHKWQRITPKEIEVMVSEIYFLKHDLGLDDSLVLAVISGESLWSKNCKSRSNARGLMQVMYPTFKDAWRWTFLRSYDPDPKIIYNVYYNVKVGSKHLKSVENILKNQYIKRKPSIREIAMGYNGGHNLIGRNLKKYGLQRKYYSYESWYYGLKIQFYYENYKAGRYKVLWDDIKERGIILVDNKKVLYSDWKEKKVEGSKN
jgi:hypothetical protein